MKFLPRVAALFASLVVLNVSAAPPAGYYLVWSDEFNGTSLDTTKWWVWNQPDRSGYSAPFAVTEGGGYLTLHTYTVNGTNFSPIVSSDPAFRERYGYTEASVEFNGSPGMFSDFWLNSANNGEFIGYPNASGAEIDVCEHRATDANDVDNISGMVTIDIHWDGYVSGTERTATPLPSPGFVGTNLGTGFHTYGFLWNNTNYSFTLDGTPVWNTSSGVSAHTEVIMFSSEVDSNSFCGIVPPGGYGNFLVSTTTTVVDYLRFYSPTTTVYWTGSSSATWATGGNWLSNMVPTLASDVVFSHLSLNNFSINLGSSTAVNSLSIQETPSITISGNTLTINSGGIDMFSAINNATINSAVVLGAAQTWNVGDGYALNVTGHVSGFGNLTLAWLGTVVMAGTNTCSGVTTISNGTLQVTGSMTNAIVVAGGTLSGTGVLKGPVSVIAGGTLSPGPGFAQLAISNTLTLQAGGATAMDVNAATGASDEITGLKSVTYGGTLVINNQSGSYAAGNTFKLFSASNYSGAFASIIPEVPATGLNWNTNTLAVDGTLRVVVGLNPIMTNILESRLGSSTNGVNNPAFSFNGFSSTISANKSTAPGCTSPGSSRFTSTATSSTSFSVTPTLLPGTTYSVSVSWGYIASPFGETSSLVVSPTATGVVSDTFPATTAVFSSGSGDVINNTWETVGTITPSVSNPVITFTYVSGLTSGRWYADAVQFISQPPIGLQAPQMNTNGVFSFTISGNIGALYSIQSSTNLLEWTSVETVSNATGSVNVLLKNPPVTNGGYYYRAVVLP